MRKNSPGQWILGNHSRSYLAFEMQLSDIEDNHTQNNLPFHPRMCHNKDRVHPRSIDGPLAAVTLDYGITRPHPHCLLANP